MALPDYFEFQDRTRIVYGCGTLENVGKHADNLGGKKALIVTGETAKRLGFIEQIIAKLADFKIESVGIVDGIPPNSGVEIVEKGYRLGEEKGADIVITIGGGSIIDTAKGINVLLSMGGNLVDDYQGTNLITHPLRPLIAIPTTAGSGSEVTFAAVIMDSSQQLKLSFMSPYLGPDVAILDPEVTRSMTPQLTASTGMDALCHAIESIHSTGWDPIADSLALHAVRLISENIQEAATNPDNLEARGNMLLASAMAGLAFSNTMVGCVHGMAHALGGVCEIPHGIANSIMLPFGMEYNLEYCPERYQAVARALGVKGKGLDAKEVAIKGIRCIRKLTKNLGLPQRLRDVGVKEEDIPRLVDNTMGDGTIITNPREVLEEEILEIFKKAF